MEVVLLKDVPKVGKRFDIITVADGYALHCLIPQGLAQAATPATRAMVAQRKAELSEKKVMHEEQVAHCVQKIDGKTVTITEKVNDQGHLFGALHKERIASCAYDQLGVEIPPDCMHLEHPIKEVGDTKIKVGVGNIMGTITVRVEAQK